MRSKGIKLHQWSFTQNRKQDCILKLHTAVDGMRNMTYCYPDEIELFNTCPRKCLSRASKPHSFPK